MSVLPAEIAEAAGELLAPPGLSPWDYQPVSSREVAEMAFLIGWLPSRDHATYLPVAVPARRQ